jgi:hypothetical protein
MILMMINTTTNPLQIAYYWQIGISGVSGGRVVGLISVVKCFPRFGDWAT